MSKLCILQMADAGPAESTAHMLQVAGYKVRLPDERLRNVLRSIGCSTVLSPRDLTAGMGYDPLHIPEVGPEGMERCDLYCDVKAHQSYEKIVRRWPRMAGRVLWTRINGGEVEHVIRRDARGNVTEDCGNEVDPPCPVLTANLNYNRHGPWSGKAYACWFPFVREAEYYPRHGRRDGCYDPPVCLIHGISGWGYDALTSPMRQLGVRCLGVRTPDGLVPHSEVPRMLSRALCSVHLKSSDAPGYAIYESLAAGCPLICTRRLIWRCNMSSLLVPGETCLVFDRETHDPLSPEDVRDCTREVADHLERLRDPQENSRIGLAGRERLLDQMWDADQDGPGFREWMERQFPQ